MEKTQNLQQRLKKDAKAIAMIATTFVTLKCPKSRNFL